MSLKITSISLKGFRTFRELEIQRLGRVNLITGKNNTGKSSLLEALRLFAWNGAPTMIQSISREREEIPVDLDQGKTAEELERMFLAISSLFRGFPQLSEKPEPIVVATSGDSYMKLTLDLDWIVKKRDEDGNTRLVRPQGEIPGEANSDLALIVKTDDDAPVATMLGELYDYYDTPRFWRKLTAIQRIPCFFVSPNGGTGTTALAGFWDRIALTEHEQHVIRALRIIDRNISAVSMVGDKYGPFRTAIVRADNINRPVPLRSFGDGLNRLFGIVLSLINARNGLLLIDEFENGLHHTVQHDVWRIIFELARDLDIQIFATSHSWDAVEAFQRAAQETPEEGVLIRLTRREEEIIPTVFTEDELAVATRDRIEVR